MRMLIAVIVTLATMSWSKAEDKPFYLNRDGTVTQRLDVVTDEVEKLRGDVDMLRAEIARLKGQDTVSAKTKPPATAAGFAPSQIVYQVCVNGKCQNFVTDDIAKVPLGAKIVSARAVTAEPRAAAESQCPTGPCGDNCQCAGATSTAGGERSGVWFPGKRVVKRIFGGSCQ